MDWTFQTATPAEPDEPDTAMKLPPAGAQGLPAGFRPTLKHTTTEPVGQFRDFVHPAQLSVPISSSPTRDSMASMIDLDMGLADPSEITRPSTASSTAGSVMTDMTSGNPFDLEDDPEQNEVDRDRFSYHKQWQSEGGQHNRRSYKNVPMHSRGSSLTSTDSELDRMARAPEMGDVLDYDYSRKMSDSMRNQLTLDLPEEVTAMNHWPNFGPNSGLDESPQYQTAYIPQMGDPEYPLQHGLRTNGVTNGISSQLSSGSRDGNVSRTPHREIEFPELVGPHPDTLLEDADPQVIMAELDRMLDDFGQSLRATTKALREHSGVHNEEMSSETDSGIESSTAPQTADEDGF